MQPASKVLRAVAAAVIVQISATGCLRAESKLLFNLFVPPKHPFNTGIYKPWAQRVALQSNGRVKVEFSSASLDPPQKQWNLITKGIADVTMLANPFERNRLILLQIATLPVMGPSAEKGSVALWRTHRKLFERANEYKGIQLLGLWTNSGSHMFHRDRSVTRVPSGLGSVSFSLIMNRKKFGSLSETDRAAIFRASGDKIARARGRWTTKIRHASMNTKLRSNGLKPMPGSDRP